MGSRHRHLNTVARLGFIWGMPLSLCCFSPMAHAQGAPTFSITPETLASVNTMNAEEYLNTLPMVIPHLTGFSNNPGDGTASIDLRGLGAERSLVLVNGHSFVPTGGNSRVDLNAIPIGLVKRIDITDSGDLQYGTGAIGGAVNFILDDEFVGKELTASYGLSGHGDAARSMVSIKLGTVFKNGRGGAMFYAGYTHRSGVLASERDFSKQVFGDGGTALKEVGSSGVPGTRLFEGYNFTSAGYRVDNGVCVSPSGAVAEGLNMNCFGGAFFDESSTLEPWVNSGPNSSRYNYAPLSYLQIPQEQYDLAAFGRYSLGGNTDIKLSSIFTSNSVPTQLAPTPLFNTVTINLDTNPFLTPTTRAVLRTGYPYENPIHRVFIGRRMTEIGMRRHNRDKQNLHLAADLNGILGATWSWDAHAHYGRERVEIEKLGGLSGTVFAPLVFSGQCNIFGAGVFSDDCVRLVSNPMSERQISSQVNIAANVEGALPFLKLPKASNAPHITLGAEFKGDTFERTTGTRFEINSSNSGFNEVLPLNGTTANYDVYGDVLWPLIESQPWFHDVSLQGEARYSHFKSDANTGQTAKDSKNTLARRISLNWSPSETIHFYADYGTAFRNPNIQELFAPQSDYFPHPNDPCASYGLEGPLGIRAICIANGVPSQLYGSPYDNQFARAVAGGNQNLEPEQANMVSLGMDVQVNALPNSKFSIQYSVVDLKDIISSLSAEDILDQCFVQGALALCDRVHRSPSGIISYVDATVTNFYRQKTRAIDVQISHQIDLPHSNILGLKGVLDFDFMARRTLENSQNDKGAYRNNSSWYLGVYELPDGKLFDCAGYHYSDYNMCGEPLPKWKHTASLSYSDNAYSLMMRWRYMSSTTTAKLSPQSTRRVSRIFARDTGPVHYFDLSGDWKLSKTMSVTAGISNIFDRQPPLFGVSNSDQANTFPSTYDVIGRQFFVSAKTRF